ncbi:MAG: hypothetical protein Q8R26_02975 [bacterium]|nr:hypothetical protein [bacterium]
MSFKTSLIVFGMFMAVGISGLVAIQSGWYPIAMVNFDIITRHAFERNYFTAATYYENAVLVYGKQKDPLEIDTIRKELTRATLDKLILDSIIAREVADRVGSDESDTIAEQKISAFITAHDIDTAVETLYGVDFDEFKSRILIPQAYREILEGRMLLDNENFDAWLAGKKQDSSVFIFFPGLEWRDSVVQVQE